MQQEFDANFPELGIHIIGINEIGQEFGNVNITEEMPWLQDVDTDGDGLGDVWQLWDVQWRDLTILDRSNVPVATYNLTEFNLADPAIFATVRQALLDIAADAGPAGEGEPLDPELVDQVLTAGFDD